MSDIMTPIPFGKLMNWILEEHKKGSIFGIKKPFAADPKKMSTISEEVLKLPSDLQQVPIRSLHRILWHPMWPVAASLS